MGSECGEKCEKALPCGHDCLGTCSDCEGGRLHVPCQVRIVALLSPRADFGNVLVVVDGQYGPKSAEKIIETFNKISQRHDS